MIVAYLEVQIQSLFFVVVFNVWLKYLLANTN